MHSLYYIHLCVYQSCTSPLEEIQQLQTAWPAAPPYMHYLLYIDSNGYYHPVYPSHYPNCWQSPSGPYFAGGHTVMTRPYHPSSSVHSQPMYQYYPPAMSTDFAPPSLDRSTSRDSGFSRRSSGHSNKKCDSNSNKSQRSSTGLRSSLNTKTAASSLPATDVASGFNFGDTIKEIMTLHHIKGNCHWQND